MPRPLHKHRKWLTLFAMTSCIAMIFVDITVLPIALPTIHRQLNLSEEVVQWIINAYTLSLTIFVIAGGKIGDILGLRKVFCIGLFLFALSSACCGASPSAAYLLAGRVLQGIGGAILIPTSAAILQNAFPMEERGKANGIYVSIGSIFLALGPFIGGVLTQYASWRMIFFINLPIAAIGFLLTLYFVPIFEKKKEFLDWPGILLLAFSLSCLITPLMQVSQWGWSSPAVISLLCIGIMGIGLLLWRETRIRHPLLELHLFKDKTILGSTFSIVINQFQLMITVFWAIYFQNVLGYSPSQAGSIAFLANAPLLIFAPFAGFLVDRYGPRLPVVIGYLFVLFSLNWFSLFPEPSLALLLPALIPFGCGVAMIFTPCYTSAMNQFSEHKRGLASGVIATLRQFSATLGLALLSAFFYNEQHATFQNSLLGQYETAHLNPSAYEGLLAKTPSALENFHALPSWISEYVYRFYTDAWVKAFSNLNLLAACVVFIGLVVSFSLLKPSCKR